MRHIYIYSPESLVLLIIKLFQIVHFPYFRASFVFVYLHTFTRKKVPVLYFIFYLSCHKLQLSFSSSSPFSLSTHCCVSSFSFQAPIHTQILVQCQICVKRVSKTLLLSGTKTLNCINLH